MNLYLISWDYRSCSLSVSADIYSVFQVHHLAHSHTNFFFIFIISVLAVIQLLQSTFMVIHPSLKYPVCCIGKSLFCANIINENIGQDQFQGQYLRNATNHLLQAWYLSFQQYLLYSPLWWAPYLSWSSCTNWLDLIQIILKQSPSSETHIPLVFSPSEKRREKSMPMNMKGRQTSASH